MTDMFAPRGGQPPSRGSSTASISSGGNPTKGDKFHNNPFLDPPTPAALGSNPFADAFPRQPDAFPRQPDDPFAPAPNTPAMQAPSTHLAVTTARKSALRQPQSPVLSSPRHVRFNDVTMDIPPPPEEEEEKIDYVIYHTLYAYQSDDPDDLCFGAGDIIHVTDEGDGPESWFYGRSQNGKEGSFPGTYVRKLKYQPGMSKVIEVEGGDPNAAVKKAAASTATVSETAWLPTTTVEPAAKAAAVSRDAFGFGFESTKRHGLVTNLPPVQADAFMQNSTAALTTAAGTAQPAPSSSSPPKLLQSLPPTAAAVSSPAMDQVQEADATSYVLYAAIYDYNSGEEGDLSFKADDIIRVTDEGDGPQSWFYGESQTGEEGSFPGTYVRKLTMAKKVVTLSGLEHT